MRQGAGIHNTGWSLPLSTLLHCFNGASTSEERGAVLSLSQVGDNSQFPICGATPLARQLSSHTSISRRPSLPHTTHTTAPSSSPASPPARPAPFAVPRPPPAASVFLPRLTVPCLPTSPAYQHGHGPIGIDVPPSGRHPAFRRPFMGGRQDVCLPLSSQPPAHPAPGSTYTFMITATNVAFAKPLASCLQKPRFHQTLRPQSTLNRASCSSPSHAFLAVSPHLNSSVSGGGVSFGCFSLPKAMAQEQRMLWSTPRYVHRRLSYLFSPPTWTIPRASTKCTKLTSGRVRDLSTIKSPKSTA